MKTLKLTVVALMAIFMGLNFASCSDEKDEPLDDPEEDVVVKGLIGTKWNLLGTSGNNMELNIEFLDEERCAIESAMIYGKEKGVSTYVYDEELNMGMVLLPTIASMETFLIEDNVLTVNGRSYEKDATYKAPKKKHERVGTIWYNYVDSKNYMQIEIFDEGRIIQTGKKTGFEYNKFLNYTVMESGVMDVENGSFYLEIHSGKLIYYNDMGDVELVLDAKN
jgi:hypothetical protein